MARPHIRRLTERNKLDPAHAALRLAADTRSGHKPDNRQQWQCSVFLRNTVEATECFTYLGSNIDLSGIA